MSEQKKYIVANPVLIDGDLILKTPLWFHYMANKAGLALSKNEASEAVEPFEARLKKDSLDADRMTESALLEIAQDVFYDETIGRELRTDEYEFLISNEGSIVIDI